MKESPSILNDLKNILKEKSFDEEERFNIKSAINYFKEFQKYEDKLRTSILFSTTTFLNLFQDYRAAEIFCPKEQEVTIGSMDEIIDSQKSILLYLDI